MSDDRDNLAVLCFRDLFAWQHAFELGTLVHRLSAPFPSEERYGLTSQLRRAAVSVAANIAEGYGRGSTIDYIRFLKIARASLYETDTLLLFAVEFRYLSEPNYTTAKNRLDETERTLAGLIRSVELQLEKAKAKKAS